MYTLFLQKIWCRWLEDLENIVTPEEKTTSFACAMTIESQFQFYSVNEAIKASVFSQAGMLEAAKQGKNTVSQLMTNTTNTTIMS